MGEQLKRNLQLLKTKFRQANSKQMEEVVVKAIERVNAREENKRLRETRIEIGEGEAPRQV